MSPRGHHSFDGVDIRRYTGSAFAEAVTWRCSCGKSGTVHDGPRGATVELARAAFRRHRDREVAKADRAAAEHAKAHPVSDSEREHLRSLLTGW